MSPPAPDCVTVHLMRHGAPMLTGLMLGRTDVAATPDGIAACVAQAADLMPSAIVSSDLLRARGCAEAIAARAGQVVAVDPRWRELDFGAWDGAAARDVDAGALARFWADPERDPPPGGERWSEMTARVGAALAGCGDGALVVTHAGSIRAALAVVCGLTAAQGWALDLPCSALLTLRLWRGEPPMAQIVQLRP